MPESDLPIVGFADPGAWESWLAEQHALSPGVWLKIAKKGSGVPGVSYPEALEVSDADFDAITRAITTAEARTSALVNVATAAVHWRVPDG